MSKAREIQFVHHFEFGSYRLFATVHPSERASFNSPGCERTIELDEHAESVGGEETYALADLIDREASESGFSPEGIYGDLQIAADYADREGA